MAKMKKTDHTKQLVQSWLFDEDVEDPELILC